MSTYENDPRVGRVPTEGHDAINAFQSLDGAWVFEQYRRIGWLAYVSGHEKPATPHPFGDLKAVVDWAMGSAQ